MHNQSLDSINNFKIQGYNSNHGLTDTQVAESRALYGDNTLTPPEKQPMWIKFAEKFNDPLIKILSVALLLSIGISCYEAIQGADKLRVFLEPAGIAVAIFLATFVGFVLEQSAAKKFDMLNQLRDETPIKVLRNGNITTVPRRDIVVGDVIILETGEKIPADGTLIASTELSVNESTLTGELHVHKSHVESDMVPDATYPTNRLMRGTVILEGDASMIATSVGDATEYGKVFKAVQIDSDIDTPLTIQLSKLGKLISYASYVVGAIIILARTFIYNGDYLSFDFLQYSLTTIMLSVTLIVVSVPEGLPMSVTLSLALSMKRMLATNNLVRRMHACETMGAITVICTDKTGTLTQNRMSVYDARFASDSCDRLTALAIAANTTAHIDHSANGAKPIGNPTEGALLLWLYDNGYDYMKLRSEAHIEMQIPFSTERKYMATVITDTATGNRYLFIKGAPEIIIERYTSLDSDTINSLNTQLSAYQRKAMRTLGFAYATLEGDNPGIISGAIATNIPMKFMGITAISDPTRNDVPEAIKSCQNAGINVIMVTGDTPGTAAEIGRQTGLIPSDTTSDDTDVCITGAEFATLSDEEALKRLARLKIMSRARPGDKSRLVKLLQQRGEVVAVTGDGTNDAPALNVAQVGLAMGSGTAVAKEAGDITIIDDSFASITRAVMWGRSLYRNIQRFIIFQLTVNVVACVIVAIGAFTSFQSPLTVTQMLWVNLIMDTFAALALASLPPNPEVLNEKPRKPSDFIITRPMTWFILGIGSLFTLILFGLLQYIHNNHLPELCDFSVVNYFRSYFDFHYNAYEYIDTYELTIFFTIFVAMQFWNLFNAKSFLSGHSPLRIFQDFSQSLTFFGTAMAILVGQALIVAFGGTMFSVTPLSLSDFTLCFVVTTPVLLLGIPFYKAKKKA